MTNELHYDDLAPWFAEEPMSREECREVIDILSMSSALKRSYEGLPDKSGIEPHRVEFAGFDGNSEAKQMAYARYFCDLDGGRFKDLDRGATSTATCLCSIAIVAC